ncbi:MAG TPA: hypothetical protein VKY74_17740 [Chloroflexia bacterium]|nr:hypothetical protein [Chloroflexia bacterium]
MLDGQAVADLVNQQGADRQAGQQQKAGQVRAAGVEQPVAVASQLQEEEHRAEQPDQGTEPHGWAGKEQAPPGAIPGAGDR